MTKTEPDPLDAQLGTYACALFDLGLCWSVQGLQPGLDHGYAENLKPEPRESQFMLHLPIRAQRTPDSLVSFPRLELFLL